MIWRYDPLFTNEKYTVEFHREAFARTAEALKDHTERCMLGFIDHYPHIRRAVGQLNIEPLLPEETEAIAVSFKAFADGYGIRLDTCTVKVDLRRLGIPGGLCVDKQLIERITGYPIAAGKDKNQRAVCNCIESIDIGSYESCLNGCVYCYAIKGNYHSAVSNKRRHDPESPLLIGTPDKLDKDAVIRERPVKSLRDPQFKLM
mgnify:FL=1